MKTTIADYLSVTWAEFSSGAATNRSIILIDKLHYIKFLLKSCRTLARKNYVAETFTCAILNMSKLRTRTEIDEMWIAIVKLFCLEFGSDESKKVIEKLSRFPQELKNIPVAENEDCHFESEESRQRVNSIRKSSPFYKYFLTLKEKVLKDFCKSKGSTVENQVVLNVVISVSN
ncbi:MAG: hypothetical protein FJ333_08195 [Sphingomonadales bacterium]|nr:hypothetical protein [Sphingomonadales bacterium]